MMHDDRDTALHYRVTQEARHAEALRVLTVGLTVRITEEARRTERLLARIRHGYAVHEEGTGDDLRQ